MGREGEVATVSHAAVLVGSVSTAALSANVSRQYALFINDSDEAIYLKVGVAAVENEGIRLNASGGSWEMSWKWGNLHGTAVNSICSSGSKTLLVTEGA